MPNESLDEPFRLRPPEPPKKKAKFENQPAARQVVLFSGLDCLPNQDDLFETNGQKELTNANIEDPRP